MERTLYSRGFEFMVGGPWLAAVDAHEGSSPPVLRAQPCAAKASQDVIAVLFSHGLVVLAHTKCKDRVKTSV